MFVLNFSNKNDIFFRVLLLLEVIDYKKIKNKNYMLTCKFDF